jgi:hypothetical protein
VSVEVPLGVVTVTLTVPVPTGETAVIDVSLFTTTPVAALLPKATAVAPVRLVPVMVTEVPPASGPEVGLIEATLGTAELAAWAMAIGPGRPPSTVETAMARASRVTKSPLSARRRLSCGTRGDEYLVM